MSESINKIVSNISKHFIGKEEVVKHMLIALLAGGHILIEDVPGVGKTTLAKALADSVECEFGRIQLTPDTLPSDITGASIYNSKTMEFDIVKGPIHNRIVLADEINRTSPRTQAALLEAMEEKQVTIDKETFKLPDPFMVIATQNPAEQIGTYPLPEAELDRFMMKVSIGYPDKDMQIELAKSFLNGELKSPITPVVTADEIIALKSQVADVIMNDEIIAYALEIVDKTRGLEELEYGLSPRAGLDLLMASKACAFIEGRDFVIPEDVISMAKVALPHRLVLTSKSRIDGETGIKVITRVIEKVKRPR